MANINVTWTALGSGVTDVDSVEVWRCDDLSKTSESDFQTALDGDKTGITLVEGGLSKTSDTITTPDEIFTGTYYYCVAAKNTGGYKVGAGDGTAVGQIVVA